MLANTVEVRKAVNEVLNTVPFNYMNKSWTDRDWRKVQDDGKRRVSFEVSSHDIQEFGRHVKQKFLDLNYDNQINVTKKYVRVASKI